MDAGVAAKVPAIMTGATTTTGALVSSTAVAADRTIDEISCFRQLFFLLNLEDIRAWVHSSSFLRPHRFSRTSSGAGENLLKDREQALFYVIRKLVSLCKRDRPRRHKVCNFTVLFCSCRYLIAINCFEIPSRCVIHCSCSSRFDSLYHICKICMPLHKIGRGPFTMQGRHVQQDCCSDRDLAVQGNANMLRAGKQSFATPVGLVPDCLDVVGLGQAMVSLSFFFSRLLW
jgi:hypothetical protein